MSLAKNLTKGTRLHLPELLSPPAVSEPAEVSKGIVKGSYTVSSNWGTKTIQFFSDDASGKIKAVFLPWAPGAINYAVAGGREVLSGPFTGCIMAIYKRSGGEKRVAHVCTEPVERGGVKTYPAKSKWESLKKEAGFTCKEKSTVGILGGKDQAVWCVADVSDDSIYLATVLAVRKSVKEDVFFGDKKFTKKVDKLAYHQVIAVQKV